MRLSLQTKILLLVGGTAAIIAAVLLIALSTVWSRQSQAEIRGDQRAASGLLSLLLTDGTAKLREQSQLLASQSGTRQLTGSNDPHTFADSAGEYKRLLDVDAVIVTSRDASVSGASGLGTAEKDRAFLRPGIDAALGGANWSGVLGDQNRLMLCVCVPIKIGDYVWGSLTTCRSIDSRLAGQLQTSLGSDVAFVYDGSVVGASLPLPPRIPTPRQAAQIVSLKGRRYIALSGPLPGASDASKMSFVTLRSYDQAMTVYYRTRFAFAVITVATLLIALTAGIGLAQSLIRPLDGIVQAARILHAGQWPEKFAVQRSDEIGLLQSTFNEMSASMRASQERLLALLHIDPLTELENHRSFQERLTREGQRCAQLGEALSVILIDIDHFQEYNQHYGHSGGDVALLMIAGLLREQMPEIAGCARYGGGEFAALLPRHNLAQAAEFGERLRGSVQNTLGARFHESGLTVSVGCAELGAHASEVEGLILAAELALARAKQMGRNQVCRFDSVPGADESSNPFQLHKYLKDESLATIQALAAAVDAKDPYTRGHSQSVAAYAAELAQWVGLSPAEINLIYTAGTLHDVGKIGVPDTILKKPARLNDDERKIMETHPALGEVIVRKVPALAATLPGVRHHHENWNGAGYPDNLAGEKIPLIARLLAVADTYDAMTSDRPYRKGLPRDVALAEIAKKAGTQFDPMLAEQFVAMMTEMKLERAA